MNAAHMMCDITIDFGAQNSCEATVTANSHEAKLLFGVMFGECVVSNKTSRAAAYDFWTFCERRKLIVNPENL